MFKLSLFGLFSQKQNDLFDYDLLVENNVMIEVKTSTIRKEKIRKGINSESYSRDYWFFRNQGGRDRKCNFYVFVGLDEKYEPEKVFVVPASVIGKRKVISIPRKFKQLSYNRFSLHTFEDKFNEIADFNKK